MDKPLTVTLGALLVIALIGCSNKEAPTPTNHDEPAASALPPPMPTPQVKKDTLPAKPSAPPKVIDNSPPGNPTPGQLYVMKIGKPPIEFPLRWIPPGSFQMGSDGGRSDEKPVHKVNLTRGFWMGQTEVTQAQWKTVMGTENRSHWKEAPRPVENVTWDEAREFCAKLSEMTGKQFRLPREAEWEYTCQAKSTTAYFHGDTESALQRAGWYDANAEAQTHPVSKLAANLWGLYDMHGNVWEWCEDWYAEYPPGIHTDPTGPRTGTERVIRGGSWFNTDAFCRSASRFKYDPTGRKGYIGFRVLWDPPGK